MKTGVYTSVFDRELNPTFKLGTKWVMENLPAIDEVMCKLCKHKFKKNDKQLKLRQEKHEAKHARSHNDPKNKKRSGGGGNNIIGKVEWVQG